MSYATIFLREILPLFRISQVIIGIRWVIRLENSEGYVLIPDKGRLDYSHFSFQDSRFLD